MTTLASEGPGVRAFLHRVWVKVQRDDVFFMASAVAFNLLVAAIPLALLGIGLTGFVLSAQVSDPVEAIVSLIEGNLPQAAAGVDPSAAVRSLVSGIVEGRTGFTLFGALFFVWLATRLVGTLRVVLRRVFDVERTRGIVAGKMFDARVVVIGVLLLTLNLGVTITLDAAVAWGGDLFGLGGIVFGMADFMLGSAVALVSIWTLFLIVYRYLPAVRTPWSTVMVAATFSALFHEMLKEGFSWYATEIASYTSTWGALATVAILFFWIYYEALVFILSGEVAHAYTLGKAHPVQSYAIPDPPPERPELPA